MKIKHYRFLLFVLFAVLEMIFLTCLVFSIINLFKIEKEDLMDSIIYVLCYCVLISFTGMQIYNTYYSIENGSNFIEPLLYPEDKLNTNIVYAAKGGSLISFAGVIYLSLILFNILPPIGDMTSLMISVINCFLLSVFVNCIALNLYPKTKS